MGGKFYVQREGGPIGLKLTGVVAKMRMIRWMKKFNNLLLENRIRTYLNSVYVDDQSWAGRALREGVRWDKKKREMRWRVEWEGEDREKGEKNDIRSFRELREMGNSIDEDI